MFISKNELLEKQHCHSASPLSPYSKVIFSKTQGSSCHLKLSNDFPSHSEYNPKSLIFVAGPCGGWKWPPKDINILTPEPVNVTRKGKKEKESLCRYEVKDSEAKRFPRLLNMDPQCITCILSRGKQWETLKRRRIWRCWSLRREWCSHKPKTAGSHQRLAEAGKSLPRASRERGPANTLIVAQRCGWWASGFHHCECTSVAQGPSLW